jgi:hypothetical protein
MFLGSWESGRREIQSGRRGRTMNEQELAAMKRDLETTKQAIILIRQVLELQSNRIDNLENKLLKNHERKL